MTERVLVVTTVHHPDDTRIREKTLRALGTEFDVVFAARSPGPSDRSDIEFVDLSGGRLMRNLAAWRLALTGRYDLIAAHDPELLPLLLVVTLLRRLPAVFDVHEDIPSQIATKAYLPRALRRPLAALVRFLLGVAERSMTLTLAEEGYRRSFRREHPVIPNHPVADDLPAPVAQRSGEVCYVGDVTLERGVGDAVEAAGRAGAAIRVVGRASGPVRAELERVAARHGTDLHLTGRLAHAEAMRILSTASAAVSPLRALPNYLDSVPTKVLEYLAMGVPVVATDLRATREVVSGLEAVELVPPSDPVAMAAAIRRALDPGMIDAALAQVPAVRRRFTWDPDLVRAVYRDAARGRIGLARRRFRVRGTRRPSSGA